MESDEKGQTVHGEARKMVKRIINKCDEEARKGQLLCLLFQANKRIAEYTGLSTSTISRIRKESSVVGNDLLKSPGKKRPRRIEKKFHCTALDKMIIRDVIYEFYTEKKVVPSAPLLLVAIQERIEFPWKRWTLCNLLKSMGYQWKKTNNIRRILMEKPSIVACRGKYLKSLQYHRREGRNIVYVGETWVDNTLSFGKGWQIKEIFGVLQNSNSSHQLIIVHAGDKNGFVRDAGVIFKVTSTSGEYRGQIDSVNFEKWIKDKLLPNIPPNTVVVMDNTPHHSIQINKTPTKSAKKSEMIDWLVKNNIPCVESMGKYELIQLINKHKPSEKAYKIDQLLKSQGYHVVRLPPHMYEFNPIERVWIEVKKKIRLNSTQTLTFNELEALTKQSIHEVSQCEWEKFCSHVEEVERRYLERDRILENTIDNLRLNLGETDSDDSTSSEDS